MSENAPGESSSLQEDERLWPLILLSCVVFGLVGWEKHHDSKIATLETTIHLEQIRQHNRTRCAAILANQVIFNPSCMPKARVACVEWLPRCEEQVSHTATEAEARSAQTECYRVLYEIAPVLDRNTRVICY